MDLKSELRELARAKGMKYCGIASVDRFANLPAGRFQERIPEGKVNKVEDWLAIAVKDDQWNRMEGVASMCGRCLTTCPAGLAHP
jgi:epoxyqueuosine reductase QueG